MFIPLTKIKWRLGASMKVVDLVQYLQAFKDDLNVNSENMA